MYTYISISPPSRASLPPSLSHPSRWSQSTEKFLIILNISISHQALQIMEPVLALVRCRLLGPTWAQMNQNLGGEKEQHSQPSFWLENC